MTEPLTICEHCEAVRGWEHECDPNNLDALDRREPWRGDD